MRKMPPIKLPKNITKTLEECEGLWEDHSLSPIIMMALAGTVYNGREIPVAWQIELDPSEEDLETANTKLEQMDFEPDGYGWGDYIQHTIAKSDPALATRLHTTDCESDVCVIWVESVEDFKILLETTWKLIFEE